MPSITATRAWGAVVSAVILAAVAYPLRHDPLSGDSFPLSTYPMFAIKRPNAQVAMSYVIATGPGEARRHVPPELVGSSEVMQALVSIRRAVETGHASALCSEVAARVARDGRFDAFDRVAVVFGDHRAVDYLVRGARGSEKTLARCAIPRAL